MDAEARRSLGGREETMISLALVEQRTQLLTRAWIRTQLAEKR
jgi:hypothetical protein